MINILLVEDHNVVRNGIKFLIDKETDMAVAAEATNGTEALSILQAGTAVDVILTDMNMPEINGIELLKQVKQLQPKIKIVLLTMLDHEKYVHEAFKNGIDGYLLKNVSSEELLFGIRYASQQQNKYICNELALRFMDKVFNSARITVPELQTDVEISQREVEILNLIADGYTNQEIADKLFTSKRTVEGHRQNLIDKTGVRNTAALVKYALLQGIIE